MPAADYTHSPTPEEVMEYLDGEGTVESRTAIEAHLASCAACQAIAAEQRGISEHAQAWTVGTPPATLQPPAAPRARVLWPLVGAWRPSRVLMAGLTAAAAVLVLISFSAREQRSLLQTSAAATPVVDSRVSAAQYDRMAGRKSGGVGGGGSATRPPVLAEMPQSGGALRTAAVIRTATLRIVAKEFNLVRPAVEAIVSQAGGFIDQMTLTGDTSTARALQGTLRVPGDRMTDALARLRQVGQVVEDTQGSEDVTDQIVDLDARLGSARATEQRLTELLRNRTGKLSDVLEVERELARVRLDIERLDAEKTNTARRVTYATITLNIAEERKAGLDASPLSLATRIRIAAADGLESALESVAWTVLFLLRTGPTLILWSVVVAVVWLVLRRRVRFGIRDSGLGIRD